MHAINLSTADFFNQLHQWNIDYSHNIRGEVNQKYNELLLAAQISNGKIPGEGLEELGMDCNTLLDAKIHKKAFDEITGRFKLMDKYSDRGPFGAADLFAYATKFMTHSDVFSYAQVCKSWNSFSNQSHIWINFFKQECIPLVEGEEGQNRKREFRTLYPMIANGGMGEEFFGPVVGKIPCIRRECFNQCLQADPFEPEKAFNKTFKIVVLPGVFERSCCEEFPFTLDENGDLKGPLESTYWTGEKLNIPTKTRNLKILCEYPLSGQKNMPVFHDDSNALSIFDQRDTCSDQVSLFFTRKSIVGKGMQVKSQITLLESAGFKMTSFRLRMFSDAVDILGSGTCLDAKGSQGSFFVRTCDVAGSGYFWTIGGFSLGNGLKVCTTMNPDYRGVIPVMSVEAATPNLSSGK